jgi:hypothetical protein
MTQMVPFRCDECQRDLALGSGGRCARCERWLCPWHLRGWHFWRGWFGRAVVCPRCQARDAA